MILKPGQEKQHQTVAVALGYGKGDGFLWWLSSKEFAGQCRRHRTWVQSLGQEDPLEKEMATYSSILAWEIPGTEEPGGMPGKATVAQFSVVVSKMSSFTPGVQGKY